jgi:heme-degrading monooxygenase HmoA
MTIASRTMSAVAPIASFHLIRDHGVFSNLTRLGRDRRILQRTPGLQFWRLMGTGNGRNTGPSVDLRRRALFAVWDDEMSLANFQRSSTVAAAWRLAEESWHVRLRLISGGGQWRGRDILRDLPVATGDSGLDIDGAAGLVTRAGHLGGPIVTSAAGSSRSVGHDAGSNATGAAGSSQSARHVPGPIVTLTRANVRLKHWRTFARASRATNIDVAAASGLLRVVGVGEAPVGKQATISIWENEAALKTFAYRTHGHVEVMKQTRQQAWYSEELFARFQPDGSSGSWDGVDPADFATKPALWWPDLSQSREASQSVQTSTGS